MEILQTLHTANAIAALVVIVLGSLRLKHYLKSMF